MSNPRTNRANGAQHPEQANPIPVDASSRTRRPVGRRTRVPCALTSGVVLDVNGVVCHHLPVPISTRSLRPPLKWAGGKYSILERVLKALPNQSGRLFEPFVGSAVVTLNAPHSQVLLSDTNPDLIHFYTALKTDADGFIGRCDRLFVPENNTRERYDELRARFNASIDPLERSALLLYLNRHGYNGLYRVNKKGVFNVPHGRYKSPKLPTAGLRALAGRLSAAELRCCDFEDATAGAGDGDAVYFDPPYVPLSDTADFTSYTSAGFSQDDQIRLAETARRLAARGATAVISNHDTQVSRKLYKGAQINRFPVARHISCVGTGRQPAPELLAVFAP